MFERMAKINCSTHRILIKQIFRVQSKCKAFQQSAWRHQKPRQSIFHHLDVRRQRFFHDFVEFPSKSHLKHQILSLQKRDTVTQSERKNFSIDFRNQNMLWKTSLGPWESAETNGVVVRCVKRFLSHQTCGGGAFLILQL